MTEQPASRRPPAPADDLARRAARRRAPRAHGDAQGPPAEVVLRRPRLAAVRRDHPARPSTTRRGASGRSSRRTPATIARAHAAPTRSSSSARARRRRPASCSTRCATPARCARFVPFDVSEATLRDAAAAIAARVPGDRRARRRRRLRAPPRHASPAAAAGSSRSSAARSATSLPGDARRVPRATSPTGSGPATRFLLGTDLVKDVDRLVAAYDDARGRHRRVQQNVLRVMNRELDADFDVDALRARRASATPSDEWIEMRLRARRRADGARPRRSTSTVRLRRRRGDAHRDQRQVPPRAASRRELAAAGLHARPLVDRPGGDFALSLSTLRSAFPPRSSVSRVPRLAWTVGLRLLLRAGEMRSNALSIKRRPTSWAGQSPPWTRFGFERGGGDSRPAALERGSPAVGRVAPAPPPGPARGQGHGGTWRAPLESGAEKLKRPDSGDRR